MYDWLRFFSQSQKAQVTREKMSSMIDSVSVDDGI